MKVTFTGVPGEKHESVYMYGQNFPLNEAVDVTDPTAMRKLANHPHFKAEKSAEDRKIDEQVKQQFAAAATAGLMEAQADAIRRDAGTSTATTPAPAPTEPPAPPPLKSALDYQQRVEQGGGLTPQLSEAELREQLAAREQQTTTAKEAADGNADAQRAGGKGAAQAARPGSSGTGKR